ncbi:5-carboxymethyl-2-hydroxymuconate isomerase [Vibrio sp. UCD-FRSSP16_10]|uniref:5-carboxymethyl-2-hydroxymuconate Delta-isomerase n=1 Tax=unclassified Vibrio TaxID=2614977 RepID=UPI0007FECE73|nr:MULTISPECIES: 5-carboxymethyl-2-hydroxymuconate Delta-isomerase [unclassified Vibrio]OBT16461.1 5-carboxymethyl-2-hydroxymuconate isomerase [Vibrio sp. UCD-FRSSP16_30]OBT21325.1 5-carboxymethyl-2-hydroxymuconate isomerase [Vibrio sp. UCD-FRSSP16_10]
MPSLVMEYTDALEGRLNTHSLLQDMHQVMIESDLFEINSIKSRPLRCHSWLIGDSEDQHDFIHVTVELLGGRTTEQKKLLSHGIFQLLTEQASWVGSLTVNIREMDAECFYKQTNI